MFSELPKLFDRNFAIGFFLPAAILISISALLLNQYIFTIDASNILKFDYLITTTVLGLLSWVGGIVLLAVNRDIYRFMEGYGIYNPLKLFGWFEKRRYRNTLKEFEELERKYQACMAAGDEFPLKLEDKQSRLAVRLADEFPDKEESLLPTPFGNALRSFETFPLVMYGLDSIPAWGRLLAVVPNEYIELINGARAHVDFWVNFGLVFVLLQIEYVGLVFSTGGQLNWWIVGLWAVLGTIAPLRATSSARSWGHFVKSAFDVFSPKLREALGIEQPKNRQEEFEQWQNYSRALIYRSRDELPELKKQSCPPKESLRERFFKKIW